MCTATENVHWKSLCWTVPQQEVTVTCRIWTGTTIKKSYALEKVLNSFSNSNFFALFFSENFKMKQSVKTSGTIVMEPQVDSSVTHQPSDKKKKLTKVTHKRSHAQDAHIMSVKCLNLQQWAEHNPLFWIYYSTNTGRSCTLWWFTGPDPEASWTQIHLLPLRQILQEARPWQPRARNQEEFRPLSIQVIKE